MTDYRQGDVVLVPFPFGERAGGRKRPALVVASDIGDGADGDLVIAQVTSRVSANSRAGDYMIQDWKEAGLPRPAMVRCRLATLQAALILRKLGTLSQQDLQPALSALRGALFERDS